MGPITDYIFSSVYLHPGLDYDNLLIGLLSSTLVPCSPQLFSTQESESFLKQVRSRLKPLSSLYSHHKY